MRDPEKVATKGEDDPQVESVDRGWRLDAETFPECLTFPH